MPDIIPRKRAIAAGLSKYFTGEPCVNGHIAERYTQSGTCEHCIRAAAPSAAPSPERLLGRQQRIELEAAKVKLRQDRLELDRQKLALAQQRVSQRNAPKRFLNPFRALLHHADVDYFKSIMLALAMEIDPTITLEDLQTRRAPETSGERAIYTFQTFAACHTDLRAAEHRLRDERLASGQDADQHRWQTTMAARAAEEAAALDNANNGRPERLDA